MPHSTRAPSVSRVATKFPIENKSMAPRTSLEAFPELDIQQGPYLNNGNGFVNSPLPLDRWQARRDSSLQRSAGRGHSRQKSLSDAFRTIRARKASVSADIHEIGDALKAPVSWKLIVGNHFSTSRANADTCRHSV